MGLLIDVTWYCDICSYEGYPSTNKKCCRVKAFLAGCRRIKIDGQYQDVCRDCIKKLKLQKKKT